MTLSLYTLHSTKVDGEFIIQKFDGDYHCESVYALTSTECACPQGHKPKCRHRTMLGFFLAHGHIGDGWFLEWDTRMWRKPIYDIAITPLSEPGRGTVKAGIIPPDAVIIEPLTSFDYSLADGATNTPRDHLKHTLMTDLLADETVMGTSAISTAVNAEPSPAVDGEAGLISPETPPPPSPPEGLQPAQAAEVAPARPVGAGATVKRRKIP